jgi:Ca2+-binding RTX toxin-like protein
MTCRKLIHWILAAILLLFLVSVMSALAASNTVANSRVDQDDTGPYGAQDFAPPECAGMGLADIRTTQGNGQNNLILGTSGADFLYGGNGDDCILGGAGSDDLYGGDNDDVILGHDGDDNIDGGGTCHQNPLGWHCTPSDKPNGNFDTCYGGPGTDTFINCESATQ